MKNNNNNCMKSRKINSESDKRNKVKCYDLLIYSLISVAY